jgi:outer membrane protein OmpA-like peptidoglycan-associated protein
MRFLALSSISAGMVLLVMSCSLPPQRQAERGLPRRTTQHAVHQKIVQLNFTRDATFAVCLEPACPAATRKTLAVMQPATSAPAIDAATTLSPNEVFLTDPPRAANGNAAPAASRPAPVIVHFSSGSTLLSASAKVELDHAAPALRDAGSLVIAGRTDGLGSPRANQALAQARARAVRDYLHRLLPAHGGSVVLDPQGACCFIASNDTPQGRRQNRRVEIVVGVSGQVAP